MKLTIDGVEVKLANPSNGIAVVVYADDGESIGPVSVDIKGVLTIVGNDNQDAALIVRGQDNVNPFIVFHHKGWNNTVKIYGESPCRT